MQKQIFCRRLLLPGLLVGALLTPSAGQAQSPEDRPVTPAVTLNVSQQSVQLALRSLFQAAGIRFVVDADVQGFVNLSLSDVPYPVALKQVLGSVNPPLIAEMQDGITHIRVQKPTPIAERNMSLPHDFPRLKIEQSSTGLISELPAPERSRFTKIGVKHYNAGMMADLATRQGGIIDVPPNFVVPANAAALGATGPQAAAAGRILPDGVKTLYALESDNSLVIEAAPSGFARLPL